MGAKLNIEPGFVGACELVVPAMLKPIDPTEPNCLFVSNPELLCVSSCVLLVCPNNLSFLGAFAASSKDLFPKTISLLVVPIVLLINVLSSPAWRRDAF